MLSPSGREAHLIFTLSNIFVGSHHHVLRAEHANSSEMEGWRRVARFVTGFLPHREIACAQYAVPVNDETIEQMARWLAMNFRQTNEIPEDYWRRTCMPFRRTAKAVLEMSPR